MIKRLLTRLGFDRSLPVSAIDDWELNIANRTTVLAPRGAAATCLVDDRGRVQPADARFSIDWTLAAGARWVSSIAAERLEQRAVGPAVIETTMQTPSGPIVQRVGAAVVDGEPVAIIEIENTGGVAVAVGLVVRPLTIGGRGFAGSAAVDDDGITIDGRRAVRFTQSPAASAVSDGDHDLLGRLPDPTGPSVAASATSRAGAAQGCAVFPLPHTATLRCVVELGEQTRPGSAVPTLADVQRGWSRHLEEGMRVSVGDLPVEERLAVATRGVLTQWPSVDAIPTTIIAMAESGFGAEVPRLFDDLDRCTDRGAILASVSRWWQLSGTGEALAGDAAPGDLASRELVALESIIGPIATAAHDAERSSGLSGEPWLSAALASLAAGLVAIGQPEVAARVAALKTLDVDKDRDANLKFLQAGTVDALELGVDRLPEAARSLCGARAMVLEDHEGGARLLPNLPTSWRGENIEAMNVPIEGGSISFGVRWHGPRPALLWQVERASDTPFELSAPAIDPDFSTYELQGEALLGDPGWPQA